MVASAYGITPEQFLSYTPRQLQNIIEPLRIRIHNERATAINLAGGDADYIDPEVEKMMKDIERKHAEDEKARNHDKVVRAELEKAKRSLS